MKSYAHMLLLVFLVGQLRSQDTIRRFEFGTMLVTVNSFYSNQYFATDQRPVEIMNGIFFRYNKDRLGLRALFSYSENSATYATPAGWADGWSGDFNSKDLRAGAGVQYHLLKKREWLYGFADLLYRNKFTTGHHYGGIMGSGISYASTSNGFDLQPGSGLKIRTFKNVYLSSEFAFSVASGFVKQTSTDLRSGSVSKYNYQNINISPFMRLQLSVKF